MKTSIIQNFLIAFFLIYHGQVVKEGVKFHRNYSFANSDIINSVKEHGEDDNDSKYGKNSVTLLPFGDIDDKAIEIAVNSIKEIYGWKVILLEREELPSSAWYKPRKRHRAEIILKWLEGRKPENAQKIMGITNRDISTTKPPIKDWGICGLADIDGVASVVSTYRIKKKLGSGTPAEKKNKYIRRLRDLVAHEFGHSLGLEHCSNSGCIMQDARGTVLTFDKSTGKLCERCKSILEGKGYHLP